MAVKKNIIANFIGRFWNSIIGIVFLPVYINFIGIESFGLIGIFAMIQTVLGFLDMGLSTTLNRELASNSANPDNTDEINNLVFSLERIYFSIALVTGILLAVLSWFFAINWVNSEHLSPLTIKTAFVLIAFNFVFQFPGSLYQGGLMGLQKQVRLNIIVSFISTIKAIGAVLILWLVSPTIEAFVIWQLALSVTQLLLLRKSLWDNLPAGSRPKHFDFGVIKKKGRYALGIMSSSILAIILTQSDKIILSKIIKLSEFGYYTIATTIAGVLSMMLFPVANAIFPRLTELISRKEKNEMLRIFHQSSQLIALIIVPLSLSLFIFSDSIILAWTRNTEIAKNGGPILKFLVLGTMMSSLMTIPYQYTLSVGWVRFGINISIAAIIVFLPLIFFAAYNYGAIGTSFIWMLLNAVYLVFAMQYLFSRQLQSEKGKWYLQDVARPLFTAFFVVVPFYVIHHYFSLSSVAAILLFFLCLSVTYIITFFLGTPALRPLGLQIINRVKSLFKVA